MMKNEMTNLLFGSVVVHLSSAWKNVGITITGNRCDVMSIM